MNPNDQPWLRLTAAARRASDDRSADAPYGFSTRVVAQALNGAPGVAAPSLLERFALRGLIAAGALSLAAAGFGYSALSADEDYDVLTGDVVTEFLSQS